jgi:hypothetical protein
MSKLSALALAIALMATSAAVWAGAGRPVHSSIVGAWTLNKDLTDAPPQRPQREDGAGRRGGNGRGQGGAGRGGFGGSFPGGGFGQGRGGNPEDVRRRTEAVRTIMEAAERLTITETDSLVIIVDGDGRTTRLSPDGKRIKDDATGIERKTKWDGDTLVSEITGAGPGKITESYATDADEGRLHVTLQTENPSAPAGGVIHHVYDRLRDQ